MNRRGDHAYWVMWIGPRQWEGLPGEFDVGQAGWMCGDAGGLFRFFPAFGAHSAWAYQVVCEAKDVMRFTPFENA